MPPSWGCPARDVILAEGAYGTRVLLRPWAILLRGCGVCGRRRLQAEPAAAQSLWPSCMAPLPLPHSVLGFFPCPPGKAALDL